MSHDHHHHSAANADVNRAFVAGIILNASFVMIEFGAGFYFNSLALLSDAGHNLSDVASLGLSLFAFKLAGARATERFTYGFHKSTILASLVNAVILLIAVGSIGWEAVYRFLHPQVTNGFSISIVAAIGIVINALSAFLFFRSKDHDLNVKGAYLHLATDALVSVGVVIAGILISYTGIEWIDPLISLLIMGIVIISTWSLLTESLRLTIDAVPERIEMEKIRRVILDAEGVEGVHHIHVWAISTTQNALTAHVVVQADASMDDADRIRHRLKHALEHHGIAHVTLEMESPDSACHEESHEHTFNS